MNSSWMLHTHLLLMTQMYMPCALNVSPKEILHYYKMNLLIFFPPFYLFLLLKCCLPSHHVIQFVT